MTTDSGVYTAREYRPAERETIVRGIDTSVPRMRGTGAETEGFGKAMAAYKEAFTGGTPASNQRHLNNVFMSRVQDMGDASIGLDSTTIDSKLSSITRSPIEGMSVADYRTYARGKYDSSVEAFRTNVKEAKKIQDGKIYGRDYSVDDVKKAFENAAIASRDLSDLKKELGIED